MADRAGHPGKPRRGGPRRRGGGGPPGAGKPAGGTAVQRKPARGAGIDPARLAAFEVLRAVDTRDAYANLVLPQLLRDRHLTGRDAAFATELAYGTLRGQGTYDMVLAACSDRALPDIAPPVLDVLRLGAHQLLATRVSPHAAVSTSVDLARQAREGAAAGFVNAVLRRVSGNDLETWISRTAPDRDSDPAGHLSARYSHPRWIVAAFAAALGEDSATGLAETERALAADAVAPGVTLCAVPGLSSQAELAACGATAAQWSPFGAYLGGGDPTDAEPVRQGRAGVQDEASQLAVLALSRVSLAGPDRLWLDMCAGPGGKTRLLAGLAAGSGARLAAADIHPHRAQLAKAAAAGAGQTGVVVTDGTAPGWRPGVFDRVLADVPCSGLGALRRRPEARWRKAPSGIEELAALQRRLLASALDAARPGGAVAYVTCTPHLAETCAVVAEVLSGRDDVTVLDAPGVLSEIPDLRCREPDSLYAQFWPHRHGTDAIFIALLRKQPAG